MAATNHYASGRAWESVGYTTNGEADDWGWGDERVVSVTIEVGASSDGFWPSPSRILPIAKESAWPARYLAMAVGPMLQVDTVGVTAEPSGTAAAVRLALQNNGLAPYTKEHLVCVHAAPPGLSLAPSDQWAAADASNAASRACVTIPALAARAYAQLPPLSISWDKSARWISLGLTVHEPLLRADLADAVATAGAAHASGGGEGAAEGSGSLKRAIRRAFSFGSGASSSSSSSSSSSVEEPVSGALEAPPPAAQTFGVQILNSMQTLKECDELCLCNSADAEKVAFSHECRAAIAPASHCRVAKAAHAGVNWASGVVDEHFRFVATSYSRGGRCTVSSTKRDTLLAVYATCARFGSQSALGFANSEGGRTATVSFPCTAGESYYLFWNAEYMPGALVLMPRVAVTPSRHLLPSLPPIIPWRLLQSPALPHAWCGAGRGALQALNAAACVCEQGASPSASPSRVPAATACEHTGCATCCASATRAGANAIDSVVGGGGDAVTQRWLDDLIT